MFQSFTFFVSFQQLCFSFAFRQLLQPGSIDGVATKVFVVAITVTLCRDIDSSAKEDERKAYFSGETGHPSRNHRCELLLVNVSSDRVYSSAKHREKITTNDESCSSSVSSCTVCVCVCYYSSIRFFLDIPRVWPMESSDGERARASLRGNRCFE